MKQPRQERCSACGAALYFARTPKGRAMPVDVAPDPEGNVLLSIQPGTGKLRARVIRKGEQPEPGRNRYTSHHQTCPQAVRFRACGRRSKRR